MFQFVPETIARRSTLPFAIPLLLAATCAYAEPAPSSPEANVSDVGIWSAILAPPGGRSYGAAIYDPVRDRMIYFGGGYNTGTARYLDETWELSLSGTPTWKQLSPAGPLPHVRNSISGIYDPVRDRLIIFGGYYSSSCCFNWLNDVWALSLSGQPTWTELHPTGTPPGPRSLYTSIYDPIRDRMIVFGGSYGTGSTNQTWALDLTGTPAWSQLTPAGSLPSPRYAASGIYDPVADRMVIFGGTNGTSSFNDSWTLSLSATPTWTQMSPSETPPVPRSQCMTIFDPDAYRMVLFGGSTVLTGGTFFDDAWSLSLSGGGSWQQVVAGGETPEPRAAHAGVYDSAHKRMLVFGGIRTGTVPGGYVNLNDVQALSLADPSAWALLVSGTPTGRSYFAMVHDPLRDRLVVFGGGYNDGRAWYLNDTWALPLAQDVRWRQIATSGPAPHVRNSISAVYDPLRDRMLIFGGYYSDCCFNWLNDVWALSLSGDSWSQVFPAGQPPSPRSLYALVYDPVRDRLVIFGGSYGTSSFNEVWTLDLAGIPVWTQMFPAGSPPSSRYAASAVYDPVRDRVVIYGGYNGTTSFDDTWALTLSGTPVWVQLSPAGIPPTARSQCPAIYDPTNDRMLLFGGSTVLTGGTFFDDVWALAFAGSGAWSNVSPAGGNPSARAAHGAVYDALQQRMLLFGGIATSPKGYDNMVDTWELPLQNQPTAVSVPPPSVDVTSSSVRLVWTPHARVFQARVYRRQAELWETRTELTADDVGSFVYEDRDVTAGARYSYALGVTDGSAEVLAGEVEVAVPVDAFALEALRPNPARDQVRVGLTLATAAPAVLQLFDSRGRRVLTRAVPITAAGPQETTVSLPATLLPGVYSLRLLQGVRVTSARLIVLR